MVTRKNKTMKRFTLLGILTIALALPAAAERILYIDAAQPGGDPSNTWLDLSASGYDFANDLSSPATYNAADLSYDFEFSDSMTGMGDETLFDFETNCAQLDLDDNCIGTNGTPYSIVAYVKQTPEGWGGRTYDIISKTAPETFILPEGPNGEILQETHFAGYLFGGSEDNPAHYKFSMQSGEEGGNQSRLFKRIANGYSDLPILLTVTHDGSGEEPGTRWYVNGSESMSFSYRQDTLFGSIQNDGPLILGLNPNVGPSTLGFRGSMYFIEIHDVELTPAEVSNRWNLGDVGRPGQPSRVIPSSVVALPSLAEGAFDTISDYDYDIEEADDLTGSAWSLVTTVPGTGGTVSHLIQTAGAPTKSYRVVRKDI